MRSASEQHQEIVRTQAVAGPGKLELFAGHHTVAFLHLHHVVRRRQSIVGRGDGRPQAQLLGTAEVDGVLIGVGGLGHLPLLGEAVEERNADGESRLERVGLEAERKDPV